VDITSLRTVRQLLEEAPALTPGGLRHLIFNARNNGLAPAIVRVGRRVFIDRKLFTEWLVSIQPPFSGGRSNGSAPSQGLSR
jgi:hypothetical protein